MVKQIESKDYVVRYRNANNNTLVNDERQRIFELTRELVNAQFFLADEELCKRLWQDVFDQKMDKERIINLMYRCTFHDDDLAMLEADLSYLGSNNEVA